MHAQATLLKGYGRCGNAQKCEDLWASLKQVEQVEVYIIRCALDAFATLGDINRGLEALELGRSVDLSPCQAHLSILIRLCTQKKRVSDALNVYGTVRAMGIEPCDLAYNNLIHACVSNQDLETALKILDDMSNAAKHQPDIVTYSTIIKGLCDRNAMTLAMDIFNGLPERGLKADIVTYNTLIEGFAKQRDQKQVEKLFSLLISNNVKPTNYTLTILIKFYGRKRKLDEALALAENLPRTYDFKPDSFVYTAIMAACAWNGKPEKALPFLLTVR